MVVLLTQKYSILTLFLMIPTIYSIYAVLVLSRRAINSFNELKDLQNFYINSYFNDLRHRKSIIQDVTKLLFGCFLLVYTILIEVNMVFHLPSIPDNNIAMPYLFLISFAFILIFWLSHSRVNPVLMIFASTFFGLIVLVISFMILLLFFPLVLGLSMKYLESGTSPTLSSTEFGDFLDSFTQAGLGLIFIASDRTYFIWNLLISTFIQILSIHITPPYFFKRSKNAFTLVNYVFNALILLLLFVSQDITNSLSTIVQEIDSKSFEELLNQTHSSTFKELFDKFINVTLMPYIIGSFIGLLLLDRKEGNLQKKARMSYLDALSLQNNHDIEEVVICLKRSVYYGGENYELLIRSNNDFARYHHLLLIAEPASNSLKQRVINFVCPILNQTLFVLQNIIEFFKLLPSRISRLPIVLRQLADNYNFRMQLVLLSFAYGGLIVFILLDFISINSEVTTMTRQMKFFFIELSIIFTTLFLIATASFLYYRKRLSMVVFYFNACFTLIVIVTVMKKRWSYLIRYKKSTRVK